MTTKLSGDALAAARAAAAARPAPRADKMQQLRAKLQEVRDAELDVTDAEEAFKKAKERLRRLQLVELPTMFDELGMDRIGLDADGNHPACDAELGMFYSIEFPKKDDKRAEAFEVVKEIGADHLIRHTFTIELDVGELARAKKLAALLKKNRVDYSNNLSVNSTSLKAEIRRLFEEDGNPPSPAQLQKLGAFVGKMVKLKERKD